MVEGRELEGMKFEYWLLLFKYGVVLLLVGFFIYGWIVEK